MASKLRPDRVTGFAQDLVALDERENLLFSSWLRLQSKPVQKLSFGPIRLPEQKDNRQGDFPSSRSFKTGLPRPRFSAV